MKKLFYSICFLALIACQIEDDNAPAPEENFIKYYGDFADQEASNFAPIYNADLSDVTGFILLGSQQAGDSASDYYVVETDAAGNAQRSNTFGGSVTIDLNNDDIDDNIDPESFGSKILVTDNGYFVLGTASFSDNALQASEWKFINAFRLSAELEVQSALRFFAENSEGRPDPDLDLIGNDAIVLSDGNLLVVGAIDVDASSSTDFNFYARKFGLPAGGGESEVWLYTGGSSVPGVDDVMIKAFENDDQTISLIGYSNDRGDSGELGVNVSYRLLNANGNVINDSSIGFPDASSAAVTDDIPTDAVKIDGGYVITGTSTTSDNTSSAFVITIGESGEVRSQHLFESGILISDGVSLQTQASGVTISRTNDIVVVGEYPDFRNAADIRAGEALFFRANQNGQAILGTETNFGIRDGNDLANDVMTLPDGKIMMLATMDFGGGIKMMSLLKLNDDGRLER